MLHAFHWLMSAAYSITANQIDVPNDAGNGNVGVVLANITKVVMILVGMLSIIFIMVGALQLTYATGNAARATRGRQTLQYAVVGLVVAIASYALVSFIVGSVTP